MLGIKSNTRNIALLLSSPLALFLVSNILYNYPDMSTFIYPHILMWEKGNIILYSDLRYTLVSVPVLHSWPLAGQKQLISIFVHLLLPSYPLPHSNQPKSESRHWKLFFLSTETTISPACLFFTLTALNIFQSHNLLSNSTRQNEFAWLYVLNSIISQTALFPYNQLQ